MKTWLQSMTGEDQLDELCLCMFNVHQGNVYNRKETFIELLITRFSLEQPQRIQLLY